jgi:hypothetical protein
MEQFINFVGTVWLIYTIGSIFVRWHSQKEAIKDLKEHLDEKIRVVRLEKYENLLLAYDDENNHFLGQGISENEIKERLMSRFPDKIFLLNKEPFSAQELNLPKNT